jgi:hypothetical protein
MRVKVGQTAYIKAAGAAFGIGLDDDGHRIEWMGDTREMGAIQYAIENGERVYADVEPWQVVAVDEELTLDLSPAAMRERGAFMRDALARLEEIGREDR